MYVDKKPQDTCVKHVNLESESLGTVYDQDNETIASLNLHKQSFPTPQIDIIAQIL